MPSNVTEKRLEEGLNKGVIKMGWVKGVFMKCLLNIWGVMLFLRLSWVMGQTGIGQGILLISSCNIVTLLTSISMSAVTTNGQIKGGSISILHIFLIRYKTLESRLRHLAKLRGIYYMISRSLGPEFGGAIGLMFTIANSIACAMYVIGFCDSLKALLANEFSTSLIDGEDNYTRVVGCAAIVVILAIVIVGIDWVSRVSPLSTLFLFKENMD
ncbi:unnamed protein product [Darwinula stevensoni]|uniref:Amino acid permease/ SLC12A domain-containing protein n=1 Tax=Darwinula stevensoni TaxID=69355 RepID=A0A7R8XAD4_9CRUS|nr:unnamed protein product [Darwinula stevensoni]CAG0891816.1 unnamed protein product [Darwinula stevensoni]